VDKATIFGTVRQPMINKSKKFTSKKESKIPQPSQDIQTNPTFAPSQPRNTSKKSKETNLPTQPTKENHELACQTTSPSTNETNMQRRNDLPYAAVAQHRASMARTRNPTPVSDTIPANLHPYNEPYSLISDWLIDIGCTIHMTPNLEDFVGDMSHYQTIVETANVGLVEVTMKGTVKVLIKDAFVHNKTVMVYLHEVLYVPLLSRRLFSVAEWNRCGGTVNFMMDRCHITILGEDDRVLNTVDVDPIYTEEAINQQRVHSVRSNTDITKKVQVPQTLLHQCLGHRNTSTLLMAIEDNNWADTAICKDEDNFCETCRITTARKANRGHTPLETMDDLTAGSFVMVDTVTNSATSSITAASYFPYYLAILGVTSRLFFPLGLRDKTADSVFPRMGHLLWPDNRIQFIYAHAHSWRF
jgi:hypothetical protein